MVDDAQSNEDASHEEGEPTPGEGAELTSRPDSSPMPFEGLDAPRAVAADPPAAARWLAFSSILIGGLLGGMIGYGTADLMAEASIWPAIGALVGAAAGAIGVGIVAGLTLRAMNEWRPVKHPEQQETRPSSGLVVRKTES